MSSNSRKYLTSTGLLLKTLAEEQHQQGAAAPQPTSSSYQRDSYNKGSQSQQQQQQHVPIGMQQQTQYPPIGFTQLFGAASASLFAQPAAQLLTQLAQSGDIFSAVSQLTQQSNLGTHNQGTFSFTCPLKMKEN